MRFIFLLLLVHTVATAQTYRVFSIRPDGKQGTLLRSEHYEQGQVVHAQHYTSDGALNYEIRYQYDDNRQLSKRVQTFKKDHEFDLIRQYTYNDAGRKSGELFGNNRTGKWGSYRYNYNPQGDIDTVFIYQKNGELTHLRVYELTYDAQDRKLTEREQTVALETDEVKQGTAFLYEYSPDGRRQKVLEQNAQEQIVMSTTTTFYANRLPQSVVIKIPEQDAVRMEYQYRADGQIEEVRDLKAGKLAMVTTHKYDANGILIEKKYRYADGRYGGERYTR